MGGDWYETEHLISRLCGHATVLLSAGPARQAGGGGGVWSGWGGGVVEGEEVCIWWSGRGNRVSVPFLFKAILKIFTVRKTVIIGEISKCCIFRVSP